MTNKLIIRAFIDSITNGYIEYGKSDLRVSYTLIDSKEGIH